MRVFRSSPWVQVAVRPLLTLTLLVGLTTASQEVASAQSTPPSDAANRAAHAHYDLGTIAFQAGHFAEAARHFEDAYAVDPRPQFLYNIFVAHRDSGHPREAAAALRRYLADAPNVQDRPQLELRLRAMEAAIAEEDAALARAQAAQAGAVTTQGGPVEGSTTQASTEQGSTAQSGGEESHQVVTPSVVASSGPSFTEPAIVIGIGAAAMIAGGVFGGMALSEQGALSSCNSTTRVCPPEVAAAEHVNNGRLYGALGDAFFFGGLAVAAGGAIWAIVVGTSSSEPPPVTAACTTEGCFASLRGGF